MAILPDSDHPEALALVQLFSTCVECFGLIHPSKEWEHNQRIAIAKLGIQQGRLLAWGDMVGLCDVSEHRDPRLEDPEMRTTIEKALQDIIDRPADLDRVSQFEKFGLKPPKHFRATSQPALDTARIESFRERLEIMQKQRWEVRRGMSVTISHWSVVDLKKFNAFLDLIKQKINFLIGLMDVDIKVHKAMSYDIRALGWHPIFDKMKASYDMAKLRTIVEACNDEYPDYVVAANQALEYLAKEYKDHYEEIRTGSVTETEIIGAASYLMAQSKQVQHSYDKKFNKAAAGSKPAEPASKPGFLKMFSRKSSSKKGKDTQEEKQRSMSLAVAPTARDEEPLTPPMTPERSKSLAVPRHGLPDASDESEEEEKPQRTSEDNVLAKVETVHLDAGPDVEPTTTLTSMISRRDYWKSPW